MTGILKKYIELKDFSKPEEYLSIVKKKGYVIPPGTAISDTNTPLDKKLAQAYFMLTYHSLPQDLAEKNIEVLGTEADLMGSNLYAFFKMPNPKPLYLITKEAVSIIRTTRLTINIDADFCKTYLPHPYFIYSGDGFTLFDDVVSIILYTDDYGYLTCHIETTDGEELIQNIDLKDESNIVEPVFSDEKGEEYILENGYVIDKSSREKIHAAFIYIVKFILLLHADKKTVIVEPLYKPKAKSTPEKEKKIYGNISYKKISLTHEYKTKIKEIESAGCHTVLDKEGKTLRVVSVTGHLRNQACGPGWSDHKIIYIEAHESKAWKKDGIQIVKVVE